MNETRGGGGGAYTEKRPNLDLEHEDTSQIKEGSEGSSDGPVIPVQFYFDEIADEVKERETQVSTVHIRTLCVLKSNLDPVVLKILGKTPL